MLAAIERERELIRDQRKNLRARILQLTWGKDGNDKKVLKQVGIARAKLEQEKKKLDNRYKYISRKASVIRHNYRVMYEQSVKIAQQTEQDK